MAKRPAPSEVLRCRLKRFMEYARQFPPVMKVFDPLAENGWRTYLFGGLLRDLYILDIDSRPRDIDIVVDDSDFPLVADLLENYVVRTTRFGGLHVKIEDWLFDIWPLCSTWAMRQNLFDCSLAELPKTTFLNVEAIVASVEGIDQCTAEILEHGFFSALRERILDINLELNPFPILCVVRSLVTAKRLSYALSRRLAVYIVTKAAHCTMDDLLEIQMEHYGTVRLDRDTLTSYLLAIEHELTAEKAEPIWLPDTRTRQLSLLKD